MSRPLTRADVEAMIEESESRMKKWFKRALAEHDENPPNTQLMVVSEDEKKAIVARAMSGVASYIQKEVIAPMQDLREMVITQHQSLDGDELVNQYRRKLHDAISGDGEETLKITGKVESRTPDEQKLREFRQKTFFFADDD